MYQSYKNFDLDVFHNTLNLELHSIRNNNSHTLFEKKFLCVLNKQAPLKFKLLQYNNNPLMSKELRKGIMLQSNLKNTCNKNRFCENWCKYKRDKIVSKDKKLLNT